MLRLYIICGRWMKHEYGALWNDTDEKNQLLLVGGTCLSAALSMTNPAWTGLGSNLGLRPGRFGTEWIPVGLVLLPFLLALPFSLLSVLLPFLWCYCLFCHLKWKLSSLDTAECRTKSHSFEPCGRPHSYIFHIWLICYCCHEFSCGTTERTCMQTFLNF